MRWLASVLVLALVLGGCASTNYINDRIKPVKGDLRGMVYDLDRRPVAQATVVLAGQEIGTATDIHGHFVLADVPFGTVSLILQKPGYEPHPWSFEFGEVSQVAYVQLANAPQLFDAAADALEQREWDRAASLLQRGAALEPDSAEGVLLSALLATRQDRAAEGLALLEAYLLRFPRHFILELAAADIAERELKDLTKALAHLERAQTLRYDPEVDLRVRALKGEAGK